MADRDRSSITLPTEDKEKLAELKAASNANTRPEFLNGAVDENKNIEVRMEDLDTIELEETETAKETRAMAVGILEAMQRTGIKEDVIDLIEELRKQEMVEMNKLVVQHILQKARNGESLNEADRALLNMVVDIERARSQGPNAAMTIAESLFGETEESMTETTTTERVSDSKGFDFEAAREEQDLDVGPAASIETELDRSIDEK